MAHKSEMYETQEATNESFDFDKLKIAPALSRTFLMSLKSKIREARQRALSVVNTQLLAIYHEIGSIIAQQSKEEGWGAKVIEKLANDLRAEFPDMKGFPVRNLKYIEDLC